MAKIRKKLTKQAALQWTVARHDFAKSTMAKLQIGKGVKL